MDNEKQVSKKPKITPVFTLLENAIKEWWKNLGKFIMTYLWGLIFAIVPMIVLIGLLEAFRVSGEKAMPWFVGVAVAVAGLAMIYFLIRAYTSIFLLVKNNYKGKSWDIFKESKKYFWPYLGLSLLTSIFILLWALLLIIPGIIYAVLYSMAVYVFFFENKRGMAAIKRSISLVKDYFWPVLGRYILLGIVMYLFMGIFTSPMYMFAEGSTMFTIWNGIVQIVSMLIGPISLIFGYHIYKDLVKYKG